MRYCLAHLSDIRLAGSDTLTCNSDFSLQILRQRFDVHELSEGSPRVGRIRRIEEGDNDLGIICVGRDVRLYRSGRNLSMSRTLQATACDLPSIPAPATPLQPLPGLVYTTSQSSPPPSFECRFGSDP